jgi:hypothetical protein
MAPSEILRRFDFSNAPTEPLRYYWIYSKAFPRVPVKTLIDGMLKPTGKWLPEHGEPVFLGATQYES